MLKVKKNEHSLVPIILAGGSGTRLWPFSRSEEPKQFLKIENKFSMLQNTILRLNGLNCKPPIVLGNNNNYKKIENQLSELAIDYNIIIEPCSKNTAPAITASLITCNVNDNVLILSSDHIIKNKKALISSVQEGIKLSNLGNLVTFGIKPTSANTNYGYILKDYKIGKGYKIKLFKEKPDKVKAEEYFNSNKYFWNSGMFLFKVDNYLDEIRKNEYSIFKNCKNAVENGFLKQKKRYLSKKFFDKCVSKSIDYAVMEKTSKGCVVPLSSKWSDIGTWESLWNISKKDSDKNYLEGDIIVNNVRNSFIKSNNKLVAVSDLKDVLIVNTKDVLLVSKKDNSNSIKKIVNNLNKKHRHETKRSIINPNKDISEKILLSSNVSLKFFEILKDEKKTISNKASTHQKILILEGVANVEFDEKTKKYIEMDVIKIDKNKNYKFTNNNSSLLKIMLINKK